MVYHKKWNFYSDLSKYNFNTDIQYVRCITLFYTLAHQTLTGDERNFLTDKDPNPD